MFCTKCGALCKDDDLFCNECGYDLHHDKETLKNLQDEASTPPITEPISDTENHIVHSLTTEDNSSCKNDIDLRTKELTQKSLDISDEEIIKANSVSKEISVDLHNSDSSFETKIPSSTTSSSNTNNVIYCRSCGAKQKPNSIFCDHCGTKIISVPQFSHSDIKKRTLHRKPLVFGVAVIACVFFLLFTIFKNWGDPRSKFLISQAKALGKSSFLSNFSNAFSKGISTDITLALKMDDSEYIDDSLKDFIDNSVLKIKLDVDKNKSLVNYNLIYDRQNLFNLLLEQKGARMNFSFPDVNNDLYTFSIDEFLENNNFSAFSDTKIRSLFETADFNSLINERKKTYFDIIMKSMNKESLKTKNKGSFSTKGLNEFTDVKPSTKM